MASESTCCQLAHMLTCAGKSNMLGTIGSKESGLGHAARPATAVSRGGLCMHATMGPCRTLHLHVTGISLLGSRIVTLDKRTSFTI